jgi:Fe-S-cluster containining protein
MSEPTDCGRPAGAILRVLDALPGSARLTLGELALQMLPAWRAELDRQVERACGMGEVPTCRRGCAACCRHPVPLAIPEAFMLARMVAGLPAARRERLLDAFEQARSRLDAAGLAGTALLSSAHAYRAASIDCPFLEHEQCSIHEWRPGACREHLALSAPARCAEAGDGADLLGFPLRIGEYFAAMAARLLGGAQVAITLVDMLDWCAGRADGEALRSWTVAELRVHSVRVLGAPAPY